MEQARKFSKRSKKGLDQSEEYHPLRRYGQPAVAGVYAVESNNLHRQYELERTFQLGKREPDFTGISGSNEAKMLTSWVIAESFSMRDSLQETLKIVETTKQTAQAALDWFSKLAKLFEGQIYLRSGDMDNAMRLARELVDFDAIVDIEFSIFYPFCIEALIANKECEKALKMIDQILVLLKGSNSRYKTSMLVLCAWAYQCNGNEEEAISTLEAALQNAENQHDLFPFINNSQYIEQILERTKGTDLIKDMLARLFAAEQMPVSFQRIASNNGTHRNTECLIEPLTERELETLRLLNSHLPTPEIADILALSVNTVRTHIKSIYAKLGVHSRSTAIDVSKKLKLLA